MSNDNKSDFHKRLSKLDGKPTKSQRSHRGERIGLFDDEEAKRRKRNKFSFRKFFMVLLIGLIGVLAIKAYVIQDMGEERYQERLLELKAGDKYQRIAGVIISRDPLTMFFERTLFSGGVQTKEEVAKKNASKTNSEAPKDSDQQ